jgi:NhaC family Na+:H+ antiporter
MPDLKPQFSFTTVILPILFLLCLIIYGVVLRPNVWGQSNLPLEMIFLLAASFAIAQLLILKVPWPTIQDAISNKLAKAFPAILILFCIGLIIGSWIISGTIPMLIYYGIKWINPSFIYVLAFVILIVFSLLTGTSWGSIGTVGVVVLGVAVAKEADLGITAGAIIGGAFFGDKLSPLSDTTNMAAMAADVDLYDHIRSMMYTTLPSAIIAATAFTVMGFVSPPLVTDANNPEVLATLANIKELFNFNLFLLLPPVFVLIGSFRKWPTFPTLVGCTFLAAGLALVFQPFDLEQVIETLLYGFDMEMTAYAETMPETIHALFERGGLYALIEPIVFALFVFVFIGVLDIIETMPRLVHKLFGFANTRTKTILSSLFATGMTNALTSNQYATSFIIGDAFKHKYDEMKIERKVLSRSIEDYGTMLESALPWTASTIFATTALGISYASYAPWHLMSFINLIVAPTIAILGIGCFYKNNK